MKQYLTNKDIMQGDWLYPHNSNMPDKVFNIDKHMYMGGTTDCITFEKDINVHYYTFMCNPVPLTPEILEKNGFVVESRYYHGNTLQYCVLVDGLWIDISGENFFEGKLEYVHQLQHALRLCGIDKTIEL